MEVISLAHEYLQLGLNFDALRLQQDLALWPDSHWVDHFNKTVNEGGWSALPLRSLGGKEDSIFACESKVDSYLDTSFLTRSPYFRHVIDAFECQKHSIRLLALASGTRIARHTDNELSFEDGLARIHIPIKTHENVEFMIADKQLRASEGECWYINANHPHSVINNSEVTRVHLVMDCVVNEWLHGVFKQAGHSEASVARLSSGNKYNDPSINDENVEEVIGRLMALNTDVSYEMAERLREIQCNLKLV